MSDETDRVEWRFEKEIDKMIAELKNVNLQYSIALRRASFAEDEATRARNETKRVAASAQIIIDGLKEKLNN